MANEGNEKNGGEFYRMLETMTKLEDCMAICWTLSTIARSSLQNGQHDSSFSKDYQSNICFCKPLYVGRPMD